MGAAAGFFTTTDFAVAAGLFVLTAFFAGATGFGFGGATFLATGFAAATRAAAAASALAFRTTAQRFLCAAAIRRRALELTGRLPESVSTGGAGLPPNCRFKSAI